MQMPEFEITMTGKEPFTVTIQQSEATRWDIERSQRKWPAQEEAWNLWATFVAWNAARRMGRIPADMTFEAFTDLVERVEFITSDDVDPTNPEVTPDS